MWPLHDSALQSMPEISVQVAPGLFQEELLKWPEHPGHAAPWIIEGTAHQVLSEELLALHSLRKNEWSCVTKILSTTRTQRFPVTPKCCTARCH